MASSEQEQLEINVDDPKADPSIVQCNMIASLPPASRYLVIAIGGSHWHAQGSFKDVVIFGDSYSKYFEGRTWVDYTQQKIQLQGSQLIHNFAIPGAFAKPENWVPDHLPAQLSLFLQSFSSEQSDNGRRTLDPNKSTYFVFIGINDCANYDDLEDSVEAVSGALRDLYVKAGARNFVLIDVPPVDRSPQAVNTDSVEDMKNCVENWNGLLQAHATEFGMTNKDATIILFSSYQVLTEVLDNPMEYGFSEHDPRAEYGGIWMDDLHLTSEVHEILGEKLLLSVLGSQAA